MKPFIYFILLTLSLSVSAQQSTPSVFTSQSKLDSYKFTKPTNSHTKVLAIDLDYLSKNAQTTLEFNLSEKETLAVKLEQVEKNYYPHLKVFKGYRDVLDDKAITPIHDAIVVHNTVTGKMVSIIEEDDKYFLVLPTAVNREYRIIENNKEELDCHVVNTLLKSNSSAVDDCNFCKEQDANGKYITDVFVAFTEVSATQAGDKDAFAAAMIESVNAGFINSDINEIGLRLVGVGVTDNNPGLVRSVLSDVLVWFEDELKENAADIVAVFINQTQVEGESGAWGQQPGRVSVNNIIRPLSFRHEIGHNFGGAHCNPDNQVVDYANGYDNGKTSTHLCGNGANYFSNPDLTDSNGDPLGEDGKADMARLIREQASFMSSYRLHTIPFSEDDENLDTDADGLCVEIDCNDGDASIGAECRGQDFKSSYENTQNGSSAIVRDGLAIENAESLTITAWIKPSSIFTANEIGGIAMGESDGSVTGINVSGGKLAAHINGGHWVSSIEVPADEWSYVALILRTAEANLCINGECDQVDTAIQSFSMNEQFVIGQMQTNQGRTFIGKIDEVTVLDKAVSLEELKATRHLIRNNENIENVISYFNFDEPIGPAKDMITQRNASITGCSRSAENAPVGDGVSAGLSFDAAGSYTFGETGLAISIVDGNIPDRDIYVTKINTSESVNPIEESAANAYWIINNYSTNQEAITLGDLSFMDASIEDGDKSLYERDENSVVAAWSRLENTGSAADNTVVFANSGLTGGGQFFIGQGLIDADGDNYTADVDCDDNNAAINPGAEEIINNDIDENCYGMMVIVDNDNDGANSDIDCDDEDASISPLKAEIPNNDIDENCDGLVFMQEEGLYGNYCAPTRADSFGFITWVQFGSIANQSEEATGDNGVSDFTSISTILVTGDTYNLSVNSFLDFDETQVLFAWIDWNADGEFEDEELVFSGQTDFETWRSDIVVPDNATGGNSIMRIRLSKLGEAAISPCGDATGETEDYSVFIASDNDDDGYSSVDDCNDDDPNINPGEAEIANNDIDENCDGEALTSSTFELEESTINVFPNPVTDKLYIRIDDNSKLAVKLVSITGQLVYQSKVFNYSKEIDVAELAAGLYFLEVHHVDLNQRVIDKIEVIK